MIIVNTKDNSTNVVREHEKMPGYMDTGIKRKVTLNSKDAEFVLKPAGKEGSTRISKRVNFALGKKFYYVDDESLHKLVADSKGGLSFNTTDRATLSAEKKEADKAAKADKKSANGKDPKPAKSATASKPAKPAKPAKAQPDTGAA